MVCLFICDGCCGICPGSNYCSMMVLFAKLVIVERFVSSNLVRCKLAQFVLVYSSWATRFSRVFFSWASFWISTKESLPVKSSRVISRSRKSSFSWAGWLSANPAHPDASEADRLVFPTSKYKTWYKGNYLSAIKLMWQRKKSIYYANRMSTNQGFLTFVRKKSFRKVPLEAFKNEEIE